MKRIYHQWGSSVQSKVCLDQNIVVLSPPPDALPGLQFKDGMVWLLGVVVKTLLVSLLQVVFFAARAETPVDPLRRYLGDVTIEVVGREVMARNLTQLLWRHREPIEFKYSGLEVTERHVVVTGRVQGLVDRPQVVLLTLQGQVVYRTFGRLLTVDGGHYYFEDGSANTIGSSPTGFRDIQVIHFNTETGTQQRWQVKARGIPEHCQDLQKTAIPYFVDRINGNWRFRYLTSECDVLVGFQQGKGDMKVMEVQDTRKTFPVLRTLASHLPLFTYPVLFLPLWIMRRKWGWAAGITLGMVILTREAVSFHLFYIPLILVVLAFMTTLVLGWRKVRRQPVNNWLLGASLSTLITFASLALQAMTRCWNLWWC